MNNLYPTLSTSCLKHGVKSCDNCPICTALIQDNNLPVRTANHIRRLNLELKRAKIKNAGLVLFAVLFYIGLGCLAGFMI